ncbi:DUF418 domain-containing protein [Gordonia sp. (in: high G+C Gram-positive bacteria)]|uniref:DUF418 domain-containing protein n=1 Tax=Gordonia sp. (in: high G+C Gram-positive bacteria) TaxID=84139 RepID=UPI003F9CDB48
MRHTPTASAPLRAARIHDVDALRGFALLGIFVVNITFMASAYPGNLVEDPSFGSASDGAARFVVSALFSMKFYLLFSFLFGYSFTLQMQAADRAGARFTSRMLRRTLGLFVLGVANIVLLYSGDILTTYAFACLILLGLYKTRDVVALRVAGGIYALVLLMMGASGLLVDRSAFLPDHAEALANAAEQNRAMLGSYGEIVGQHLDGVPLLIAQAATMQGPTALAMFLVGMVAGRRRLLADLTGSEPTLRRIQLVGFPVGLAGAVGYALLGGDTATAAVTLSLVTAPLLSAAYAATLLRAMHHPRFGWLRRSLAPAGRIALTNYLLQSVIGLLLFTGIGFGLAGTLSPPALLALAFAVFVCQLAASAWWTRRHRYGPAEWLLRVFTNWRLSPVVDSGAAGVVSDADGVRASGRPPARDEYGHECHQCGDRHPPAAGDTVE